ncbi:hypothetical protein K438DRAFT_2104886 [Mycena galopus ATCC 62051]|nr:hypothetical protein K438DRAFT_2104886 [Mycena galopus ATCC 62051]
MPASDSDFDIIPKGRKAKGFKQVGKARAQCAVGFQAGKETARDTICPQQVGKERAQAETRFVFCDEMRHPKSRLSDTDTDTETDTRIPTTQPSLPFPTTPSAVESSGFQLSNREGKGAGRDRTRFATRRDGKSEIMIVGHGHRHRHRHENTHYSTFPSLPVPRRPNPPGRLYLQPYQLHLFSALPKSVRSQELEPESAPSPPSPSDLGSSFILYTSRSDAPSASIRSNQSVVQQTIVHIDTRTNALASWVSFSASEANKGEHRSGARLDVMVMVMASSTRTIRSNLTRPRTQVTTHTHNSLLFLSTRNFKLLPTHSHRHQHLRLRAVHLEKELETQAQPTKPLLYGIQHDMGSGPCQEVTASRQAPQIMRLSPLGTS